MNIAVVGGTGYVGLTAAVCLASKGIQFIVLEEPRKKCLGLTGVYQ